VAGCRCGAKHAAPLVSASPVAGGRRRRSDRRPTSPGRMPIAAAGASGERPVAVERRPLRGLRGVDQRAGRLLRRAGSSPDPTAGAAAIPAIASTAGDRAAEIVGGPRTFPPPPRPTSATAPRGRRLAPTFQGRARRGFMVNWPYVWNAVRDAVQSGQPRARPIVDDIGWGALSADGGPTTQPPAARAGSTSPSGPSASNPEAGAPCHAVHHVRGEEPRSSSCSTPASPARRVAAAYDDPAVRQRLPMAPLIRDSIADGGPRPTSRPTGSTVVGGGTTLRGIRPPPSGPPATHAGIRPAHRGRPGRGRCCCVTGRGAPSARLGLMLAAPAFLAMTLVTAYPLRAGQRG